ncbi:acyl-[acyl-carrier-protein] thioesterase [Desulfobotulus sp.]|jgi:medium-chain acyl-[acyl-carrier-protein] hydrolase|uniref:acyl-[acyl-carrier-protein] thioesterase n=1 Tax=Desulfobotulus sp. TaxID=1940337 RepID=UPI002A35A026|nr:acyl-ACP thioesterase domain-containing protein [Desulfobotulus sp.]MDY0163448.1 thioesterase [Desulfobotulus sp.]
MEEEKQKDVFIQNCRVAYSDVGMDGCLKPVAALNFCQDVASRHAFALGVSALHMEAWNKIWVVHRYHFDFYRFPRWDEIFSIRSWRAPVRRLYEMRRFVFLDAHEKPLMESTCAWVLVDRKTGKPARLDRAMPAHLCAGEVDIPFDFEDIPPPDSQAERLCFQVLQDDMDYNRHANNAAYLRWAMEALPPARLFPCCIRKLDIRYHHDIGPLESLEVQTSRQEHAERKETWIQAIRHGDTGSLLAGLRMELAF